MEKTAVKPPWKSLRDSHFPHSPGDDGAFHFTKNTSSAESAIYPQISRTKRIGNRRICPLHQREPSLFHPIAGGIPWHWARNEISLSKIAPQAIEVVQGLDVFNTLRRNSKPEAMTKVDDGFNDST